MSLINQNIFSAYRDKIFVASPITIGVDTEEIFHEDKVEKMRILRHIMVAIWYYPQIWLFQPLPFLLFLGLSLPRRLLDQHIWSI